MNVKPLKNIKIIEFYGISSTPYARQLLADLGAEVIRIGTTFRENKNLTPNS